MSKIDLDKEVKRLVQANLYEKGFVCAVDILLEMNYLTKRDFEDWRFGRIPYLEKVCTANLNKLTLVNKLIRKYANELNLKGSWTGYNQFGKGTKRRLRFSKSDQKTIEDLYATHYVDQERLIELKQNNGANNARL